MNTLIPTDTNSWLRANWLYLLYVVRHKWFVFRAGLRIGVPIWQLVIHDWHKFLPDEWGPYRDYFYRGGKDTTEGKEAFDRAWLAHIHRGPHHAQHWLLRNDDGSMRALVMPRRFALELCADYIGAGKAQGNPDVLTWWYMNNERYPFHPETFQIVQNIFIEYFHKYPVAHGAKA